jgi:hypothetical protein
LARGSFDRAGASPAIAVAARTAIAAGTAVAAVPAVVAGIFVLTAVLVAPAVFVIAGIVSAVVDSGIGGFDERSRGDLAASDAEAAYEHD